MVVGDHGMADGGGHGGSSDPEILVPFVLISQGIQVITGFIRPGDFSSIHSYISGFTGNHWVFKTCDFSYIRSYVSGYTGKTWVYKTRRFRFHSS